MDKNPLHETGIKDSNTDYEAATTTPYYSVTTPILPCSDMEDFEDKAEISASEDEDADDGKHYKLLDAITSLDGKKKTRLHERTVHASQISEFNFTSQNESSKVNISELMGTLTSASHGKMKKQLKSVEDSDQVVSVPLPRREKERIDRSVAYEQTTEVLGKWDSIVRTNRQADQLRFPLERPVLKLHTTDQKIKATKPRTSLEMEVAALLKGSDNVTPKTKELTPAEERALQAMDLEEAKERLAELRKHRALLSYKEAKAKWQKRIKSKKYHRILKKERMKNEKKSLEELEKTDPEGYIEKLKSVDKQRIEERMSLKHRGGSKYMKKQIIYGKYDDQARQAVQDMIQKNKELTQKTEVFSDSDSEGGVSMDSEDEMNMLESAVSSADNPWMKASKLSRPTGYEPIEEVITEDKIMLKSDSESENETKTMLSNVVEKVIIEDSHTTKQTVNDETDKSENSELSQIDKKACQMEIQDEEDLRSLKIENENESRKESTGEEVVVNAKTSKKKRKSRKNNESGDTSLSKIDNIDDLFKNFEKQDSGKKEEPSASIHEKIMAVDPVDPRKQKRNKKKREKERLKKKLKKEQEEAEKAKNKESEDEEERDENIISENVSRKRNLEDFENSMADNETENIRRKGSKRRDEIKANNEVKPVSKKEKDIFVDPKKLLSLESKINKSKMPEMVVDDNDIDDEDEQRMTIAQAFADDDVVEEFSQEKKKVVDRDKPKDIDLTLPGWGEWGGQGLKISKRKKKRFIIKAPETAPRKDSNLGNVIISEQKDKAISKYQVSDLPFPFTSVKQFEQSIRAPVGKTWNPETAHKQLVKPKIVTKLGTIISPMDKEETFKKMKNKRKPDIDFEVPSNIENNLNNKKKKKK